MTGADDLAWTVEQAFANAHPSPRQVLLDGWLLRLSGGATRRTNSVNPMRAPRYDPAPVVDACAQIYAATSIPLLFRVPSIATGMEAALDRLGFAPRGETCTLFADLSAVGPALDSGVDLAPDPDEAWIAARTRLTGYDTAAETAYRGMTKVIALPKAFAALRVKGEIASMAYGVIDRDLLAVDSVATDARFRRRGFATRAVARLMHWAGARGAAGACLPVAADNAAGRALYAGLGFGRELYRYHYRGPAAA